MYPVVHVIDSLGVGGAQRLLAILAAEGLCPAVLDLKGAASVMAEDLTRRGVRIVDTGGGRPLNPFAWWRVWKGLRALPGPLVHLHLTNAVVMAGPLARLMGRRVVVTVHNTRTVPAGKPLSRWKFRLESWILRHVADHVILVGPEVAAANALRLAGDRQTVLPNVILPPPATSPEARASVRADLRQQGDIAEDEVLFVATGRLNLQKDHASLLVALARARAAGARARLWILGEGALRAALAAEAARLGLGPACQFLGARADVADHLWAADVFVLSSAWEGLPLGVLEAMAAGLPVLATSVGDLPSILGTEGGLLVPPRDPEALARGMVALCEAPDERARFAGAARAIVAPYLDTAAWAGRIRMIYDSVLAGRGSG